MDALIPPANSTAGFVVNDDRNRHRHDDSYRAALEVIDNVNGTAREANATAQRIGLAELGATERMGVMDRDATERFGLHNDASIDRHAHRNADAIERFGLKNLEATKDALKDTLISHKDDLRDLLISQKNDFKDVLLKQCQVEKDSIIQFKDAQLVAMENKADLQKQIADSICCVKSLVIEKADQTQQLVRNLDSERLRDELRTAKEELIAFKIRSTLTPAPVASVSL